jgi:hypothetical protein
MQGACVYGKKAVNAGLADGVLSFEDVFSALADPAHLDNVPAHVTPLPLPRDDQEPSMSVLEKRVASTLAALEAAKSPEDRKLAAAAHTAAVTALVESKVKKTYEKKTTETETEEDDGNKDDDDDDEEDGDGPPSKDSLEDDEDEEKAEDEKKMKKKSSSLAAFTRTLTGQSASTSVKQVLLSMHERATRADQAEERIARLEAAALEASRDKTIAEALSAGQITPAQVAWAKTQSVSSLKAYMKNTPARFAPRAPQQPEASQEPASEVDSDGLSASEREIIRISGCTVESYKKTKAAGLAPYLVKGN